MRCAGRGRERRPLPNLADEISGRTEGQLHVNARFRTEDLGSLGQRKLQVGGRRDDGWVGRRRQLRARRRKRRADREQRE